MKFLAIFLFLLSDYTLAAAMLGEWTPGGFIRGVDKSVVKLVIDGKEVTISAMGEFAFGIGYKIAQKVTVDMLYIDGSKRRYTKNIMPRKWQEQRIEGIKKKIQDPSKQDLKRIRQEVKIVRSARSKNTQNNHFMQDFIPPLVGAITGVYGTKRFYNGRAGSPHYGLDIAAVEGTPVIAPAAGTISLVQDLFYSGGTIILDHGQGISSTFIHLSEMLVEIDEVVRQGQIIGLVGSTGRSTGSHLDWRVNWYQQRLDPQLVLANKDE